MPKKSKQIQKQDKSEKVEAAPKKGAKKDNSNDWDIFSDGFKDRLSQFIALNNEVSDLKSSVEGGDHSAQAEERKERMASKVQDAAAAVLKDELRSLEEWIEEQQKTLKEEIGKIENAYESSRKTLLETGSFNEEEIKTQLASIQKKANDKKETFDNYDSLLARASSIYS